MSSQTNSGALTRSICLPSGGAVEYLFTEGITDTAKEIATCMANFDDVRNNINTATVSLLTSWSSNSRNQFEEKATLLTGQLNDASQELHDLYSNLLNAISAYSEVDHQLSCKIDKIG